MLYDEFWRAVAIDRAEANLYRVKDESEDWALAQRKNWGQVYQKRINLFDYNSKEKKYYLPPAVHQRKYYPETIKMNPIFKLYDYQNTAVENFLNSSSKSTLIKAWVWSGKALDYNEKLLTPTGWIKIWDAKVWMNIYGWDWNITKIIWVYPQGKRQCYHITFYDGTQIIADENHLRSLETDDTKLKKKPNKILTTKQIFEDPFYKKERISKKGLIEHKYKYWTPINWCIDYPEKSYFIDPYILGVLLGDWSLKYQVTVTIPDEWIKNKVNDILKLKNHKLWPIAQKPFEYWIRHESHTLNNRAPKQNEYIKELRSLGIKWHNSLNKFIPKEYLYWSKEQRLELLRGLMDTDWFCDKRTWSAEFYSSSLQLINDVRELIQSLWYFVTAPRERMGKYKKNWTIKETNLAYTIAVNTIDNPFSLERKAQRHMIPTRNLKTRNSIINIQPIWERDTICIAVDNESKTYITTWYVVTHNTVIGLGVIDKKKTKTLIISPTILICDGWQNTLKQFCNSENFTAEKLRKYISKHWDVPDVLVMTRASAYKVYDLINGKYDLLILDEAHKLSKETKFILNNWKGWSILWLTATPKRKELNELGFEKYFGNFLDLNIEALPVRVLTHRVSYEYTMEDMIKASEGLNPETPEVYRRLVNSNIQKIKDLRLVLSKLYKLWLRRFILFVDRVDYAKKIQEEFPKAKLLTWDSDKLKVVEQLKNENEYLIIAMSWCAGEWFNLPSIECWILFYSTHWDNSIEQLAWRSRRYYWDKKFCYWVDIQERSKIEPWEYKNFWSNYRLKYYRERWWEVKELMNVKSLE